jgi:hypothetical protein
VENGIKHNRPVNAGTVDMDVVLAALSGLTAVWIVTGSVGLLGHPLRRLLTLMALGVALLTSLSRMSRARLHWGVGGGILVVALLMVGSTIIPVNILAVVMVFVYLSWIHEDMERDILRITAGAGLLLALFYTLRHAVPWMWLLTDWIAGILGQGVGTVTGHRMHLGVSFSGLDTLILMLALWGLLIRRVQTKRGQWAVVALACILGGHLLYLIMLSYVPSWIDAISPMLDGGSPGTWTTLFEKAVSWNLPVIAVLLQLAVAGALLRWTNWQYQDPPPKTNRVCLLLIGSLAVMIPIITVCFPGRVSLEDKTIVFYEKGFLNWHKAEHGSYGRLSGGMYGMLPLFIENLGGKARRSPDLSEEDLADADALVLIFPDDPWAEGQRERIWAYVRQGGTLLVLGEHTTQDLNGQSRFNEVLQPAHIRVLFDSATFAVGGWLQSYDPLYHPVTLGVKDDRNDFGVVIGASLDVHYPAWPILMGRWGWSDWGDQGSSRAKMGNGHYDAGERLGDLCLVAEQPLDKGRIVVFGDTSSLTNGINVGAYGFTARLFGYLAGRTDQAHPAWRQIIGILLCVLLGIMLLRYPTHGSLGIATLGLAMSLALCLSMTARTQQILPNGRRQQTHKLAYIDASHLSACSSESWRPTGMGGLVLTLMRNDYLTFMLPELTPACLERADLLVCATPAKAFSASDIKLLNDYVTQGGVLILTAGYERVAASASLLRAFGFQVGRDFGDTREPEALGHFKSPYVSSESGRAFVRFYAGWPVYCNDPNAQVMAYGRDSRPMMMMRRIGSGKVLVVGDTFFVANQNLEWEDGRPFEGMRENADFWRWLITVLEDTDMWLPSAVQQPSATDTTTEEGGQP